MKFIMLKAGRSQGFHFHREKASFVAIHNLYEMIKKMKLQNSSQDVFCCHFCRSTTPSDSEATSAF